MKRSRLSLSIALLTSVWVAFPGVSSACERCFGAGADSPIVGAIGMSMLSLLVLVGFVFTGIIRFFKQSNTRAEALAASGTENLISVRSNSAAADPSSESETSH